MRSNCKDCRFSQWGAISHDNGTATPSYWCHRHAPTPRVNDFRAGGENTAWPKVLATDWYGEWAPTPEPSRYERAEPLF